MKWKISRGRGISRSAMMTSPLCWRAMFMAARRSEPSSSGMFSKCFRARSGYWRTKSSRSITESPSGSSSGMETGSPLAYTTRRASGMEAWSLMMAARVSGSRGDAASNPSRDSLAGAPNRHDSTRREGSGSCAARSFICLCRASNHSGRKPAGNCSSLSN